MPPPGGSEVSLETPPNTRHARHGVKKMETERPLHQEAEVHGVRGGPEQLAR